MACTGLEFCKLAFVDTKNRAGELVEELDRRLADVQDDLEHPISIHLNGCPNSCARVQVADIGLKGQIVNDADGNPAAGFQVHLGGGLGLDAGFGRKLRGHKVLSADLGDYVERVVRAFAERPRARRALRPVGRARGRRAADMRLALQYCPYCGEQDLRPREETPRGRVGVRRLPQHLRRHPGTGRTARGPA